MLGRIVLVMVIMVVMSGWLFTEQVEAHAADCQTMVGKLGQSPTQVLAVAYSGVLASSACAPQGPVGKSFPPSEGTLWGDPQAYTVSLESFVELPTAIELSTQETAEGVVLTANAPVIVPKAAARTYQLLFQGWAGQIVTIRATSVNSGEVAPLVQVITPSGKLLTFNDDASDGTLDAVLAGVEIFEDGTYTMVLSYAASGGEGDLAVSLEQHWRRGPGGR